MTEVEAIHQLAGEVSASDIYSESATDPSQVRRVLEEIRDQEPMEVQELNLEPDIYNHELLEWISQSAYHVSYCDEVLSEYGAGLNFFEVIQSAQVQQLEAIAYEVWEWLEERDEELGEDEEDE